MKFKLVLIILISLIAFSYSIKIGDVLRVDIYLQSGDVISRTTKVDLEGYSSLPYVGYVRVEGRDLDYVRELIQKRVDKFLPSAFVVVYVSQPHPEMVYFHGMITGVYDLSKLRKDQRRLSVVMALVRGSESSYNPQKVKILRKGKVIEIDFQRFLRTGDPAYDPILVEGDVVYTPKPMYVGVFGNGVAVGLYRIDDETTLVELLTKAGATLDDRVIKRITLYRSSGIYEFSPKDLDKMMRFRVEDGDMVNVEVFNPLNVYIMGEISKKVVLSERDHPTLKRLISDVGISFTGSVRWKITLIRDDGSRSYTASSPEDLPDIPLEDMNMIVVERIPQYVYLYGMITGRFDLSQLKDEERRLSVVLALLGGGETNINPQTVKIVRDGRTIVVDYWKYVKSGDEKYDMILQPGDIIYTLRPRKVLLYGDGVNQGVYTLREDETLFELLVSAGVSFDDKVTKYIHVLDKATLTVNDIEKMKSMNLDDGDIIEVRKFQPIRVYLMGEISRKVVLSERDHPTLKKLVSDIGITFTGSVKWNITLLREEETKSFSIASPNDLPEIPLRDMDMVLVERIPQYVYLYGMITGRFDLSQLKEDERRLSVVLSMVGGKESNINPQLVKIVRDGKTIVVDFWKYAKTGKEEYDVTLKPGDIIYTVRPRRVLVYGDGANQGVYSLKEDEDLFELLVNAGVSFDEKVTKYVKVLGKATFTVNDVDDMKSFKLDDGDIIEVRRYQPIRIYLMGEISRKVVLSERDHPTLRRLPTLIGISFKDKQKYKFTLIREGKFEEFTADDPFDLPDIPLLDGDTIKIEIVNPIRVFLNGVRSGTLTFSFLEKPDLKTMIYKLGLSDENLVIFVTRGSSTTHFKLKDVLDGTVNHDLKDGDFVYITPYAFGKVRIYRESVIVAGLMEPDEDMKSLLTRYKIIPLDPRDVERVELIRGERKYVYSMKDIVMGRVKVKLEDGDFIVIIPKGSRVVYVNGDIGTVVTFGKEEEMTREVLLAKLGLDEKKVREIKGEIKDKGVVWVRLNKVVRVYVYGKLLGSKVITFDYDEKPSLERFFSRSGIFSFADRDTTYRLRVYRRGEIALDKVVRYPFEPQEEDFEFEDGDFVRVDPDVVEITVFGWGVKQGRFILPRGATLKKLFVKMGGVPKGLGIVKVLRDGKIEEIRFGVNNIPNYELKDGDVLIFDEIPDDFVYVFGDVSNPGPIFVGDRERDLLRLLSLSGGLSGWDSRRKVKIIRKSGEVEEYEVDYEKLSSVKVRGGDAVYVPPRSFNRVYVLGAVKNPTIVIIDRSTTLLDALMRAGGFKKTAVKDRVYVFRGGVNGPIEIYDMRWIEGSGKGKNPTLQPGDVVYVPDSPLVSINDMIALITPMISFLNNTMGLYNAITGKGSMIVIPGTTAGGGE